MVGYHHVQYQKKLTIKSSENLVMDGRTDRFIGRCPTDVERRTKIYHRLNFFNATYQQRIRIVFLFNSVSVMVSVRLFHN